MGIGRRSRQEARKGCVVLALLACGLLQAQPAGPTIAAGGVVNAASFLPADLPGGAIAQGSVFSVFGSGFADDSRLEVVTAGGEAYSPELLHVSSQQINAVLPADTPVGEHRVRVVGTTPSNSERIKVVRASFGIFLRPEKGLPVPAVQRWADRFRPLISPTIPAKPGDILTLWGTGLGSEPVADLEILLAGEPIQPMFAGRSPCCSGVDQINFHIPDDAPTGCVVPVAVRIGPMVSNYAALPISSGAQPCARDFEGGSYSEVELTRTWTGFAGEEATDSADASFLTWPDRLDLERLPPVGACMVWDGRPPRNVIPISNPFPLGPPDGGEIRVETPAGGTLDLNGSVTIPQLPEPMFGPGAYRVSGPGGDDYPSFTGMLQANPAPLVESTGFSEQSGTSGLTVGWSGGAPDDDLVVWSQSDGGSVDLVCRARVGDESLEIPETLFANLRQGDSALRTVSIGVVQSASFELPTDSLDYGRLLYREEFHRSWVLQPPRLASTPVVLPDGSEIQAEVASNFSERQRGLMFRESMPADQGMLFLFPSSGNWRFWMLNTLIPLDILWMNEDREILYINADTPPCPTGSSCPTYGPSEASRYVLELNAGEAARRGLAVGDRLGW